MGKLDGQMQNIVDVVYNNANRMERIINDLRDAAKLDAKIFELENIQPVDMHDVITQSALPFAQMFESEEQQFINNVLPDLPRVRGDADRLIQVFTNLISNANKYGRKKTTIRAEGIFIPQYTSRQDRRFWFSRAYFNH